MCFHNYPLDGATVNCIDILWLGLLIWSISLLWIGPG